MTSTKNIERILQKQGFFVSTVAGISMYPMLRNRRDTVIISPVVGRLKKYEVPLYRRGNDYVLHRIVRVLPHSYIICGDNCVELEYGVTDEQVIGVLTGFYRDDKKADMNGLPYRIYARLWCFFYPLRRMVRKLKFTLRKGTLRDGGISMGKR